MPKSTKSKSKSSKGSVGFVYGGVFRQGLMCVFKSDEKEPDVEELTKYYGCSLNGRYINVEDHEEVYEKLLDHYSDNLVKGTETVFKSSTVKDVSNKLKELGEVSKCHLLKGETEEAEADEVEKGEENEEEEKPKKKESKTKSKSKKEESDEEEHTEPESDHEEEVVTKSKSKDSKSSKSTKSTKSSKKEKVESEHEDEEDGGSDDEGEKLKKKSKSSEKSSKKSSPKKK